MIKCSNTIASKYVSFPFLMALFVSIRTCFLFHMENLPDKRIYWQEQALFLTALMFLSEILIGMCFLYVRRLARLTNQMKTRENKIIYLSYYKLNKIEGEKHTDKTTYYFLFLATFLDCFGITGTLYVTSFIGEASQTSFALKCLQIISTGLLSYLILHFQMHRHQYCSITLVMIGITLITWNHLEREIVSVLHVVFLLFIILFASLQEVLDSWIMRVKEIQPLKLLFFEGIMGFIMSCVLILIFSFIPCPPKMAISHICTENKKIQNIQGMFLIMNWLEWVFIIVWLLCSIGYNFFSRYSNYYLSPTHRTIGDTLSTFVLWVYLIIKGESDEEGNRWNYISSIIGYAILFFGCLIYNEIIILYVCKLNYNTKFEIQQRAILNEIELSEVLIEYS